MALIVRHPAGEPSSARCADCGDQIVSSDRGAVNRWVVDHTCRDDHQP